MRLYKSGIHFVTSLALAVSLVGSARAQANSPRSTQTESTQGKAFSDAGKAALSNQLHGAVSRGDTPGLVALIVGREGLLYEGAAGKLDVSHDIAWLYRSIRAVRITRCEKASRENHNRTRPRHTARTT
jgi:hypothetical protein